MPTIWKKLKTKLDGKCRCDWDYGDSHDPAFCNGENQQMYQPTWWLWQQYGNDFMRDMTEKSSYTPRYKWGLEDGHSDAKLHKEFAEWCATRGPRRPRRSGQSSHISDTLSGSGSSDGRYDGHSSSRQSQSGTFRQGSRNDTELSSVHSSLGRLPQSGSSTRGTSEPGGYYTKPRSDRSSSHSEASFVNGSGYTTLRPESQTTRRSGSSGANNSTRTSSTVRGDENRSTGRRPLPSIDETGTAGEVVQTAYDPPPVAGTSRPSKSGDDASRSSNGETVIRDWAEGVESPDAPIRESADDDADTIVPDDSMSQAGTIPWHGGRYTSGGRTAQNPWPAPSSIHTVTTASRAGSVAPWDARSERGIGSDAWQEQADFWRAARPPGSYVGSTANTSVGPNVCSSRDASRASSVAPGWAGSGLASGSASMVSTARLGSDAQAAVRREADERHERLRREIGRRMRP